ncbi:MAG: type II secretion system F family protein [Phycisphaerales bacterium]|nr:MAG: type II secretion system F family protein [Phycisphaerales bacterium]
MKSYRYIARDMSGTRKQGLTEAASANDVLSWLRQHQLTPVSVNEVSTRAKKSKRTRRRKRLKAAELAAFCSQLMTMVEGGIPVTTALETVAKDQEHPQFREVLQQVAEGMRNGEPFSESMSRFPTIFNKLSCAIVLAGETGGNLSLALGRLAEYYDNRDKLKKKVKSATSYPIFIFVFIVLAVVFIMAFIVPRFRTIFDQLGAELPAFTQAFLGFYDALRDNVAYIMGFTLLLIISTALVAKTKSGHCLFSKIALRLPLMGKVFSQAFVAMFCRTMATLLEAGVSVLDVFDILSGMTGNDTIRSAIVRTREHIVEGSNVSLGMATVGFFPNMVVQMTRVGEESGSLSRVLERTADYYERKVDATITAVMSLLEPIMIVTVGAIVMVVVLALYLPIFSMSDIGG